MADELWSLTKIEIMTQERNDRTVFGKQPARILLVDFYQLADGSLCQDVCEAVHDVTVLSTNIAGPPRIPFLGIYALGEFPETMFPLQNTKASFPRLLSALVELSNYQNDQLLSKPATCCVAQAVQEAAAQYKRQAQSFLQSSGYWCQLEITIVTCRSGSCVKKLVENSLATINSASLKVQVVCIQANDSDNSANSQRSARSDGSDSGSFDCNVDVIYVRPELLSLQNHFKSWLVDYSTDTENLRLVLPSVNTGKNFVLKCDVRDCLINPAQLPHSGQYHLQPSITCLKSSAPPYTRGQGLSVDIHRIQAVHLVPISSLCESVLFGMPCIVTATSCWKIDWNELECNQQHFYALCQSLQEKEIALIGQLKQSSTKPSNNSKGLAAAKPLGYFAFLPSQTCALLVRPVAVSELMLPNTTQPRLNEPAVEESLQAVHLSLNQLETLDSYNPYRLQSNLYASLSSSISRKRETTPNRLQKRKITLSTRGKNQCRLPAEKNDSMKRGRNSDMMNSHDFPTEL